MYKNKGRKGSAGFFEACTLGNIEDCTHFLLRGTLVNSRNRLGHTGLMMAAENGRLATVKLLMEHKADRTLKDNWGYTALMKAAARGYSDIFKFLLNQGASFTCEMTFLGSVTAVTEAALNGHNTIIELCLAQDGQLVDEPVGLTRMTPLMLAVVGRHQATVKLLLKHKAKLNLVNSASQTAMDIAQQLMDDAIIRILNASSRRSNRDLLEIRDDKFHKNGFPLTPTSRFPVRNEVECSATHSMRRSKSKERTKTKRNSISKSDEIFRFILQTEGLETLWEVFTNQEIDLRTFFFLDRNDFASLGITEERTICNLMTVSHHYKPLFSI